MGIELDAPNRLRHALSLGREKAGFTVGADDRQTAAAGTGNKAGVLPLKKQRSPLKNRNGKRNEAQDASCTSFPTAVLFHAEAGALRFFLAVGVAATDGDCAGGAFAGGIIYAVVCGAGNIQRLVGVITPTGVGCASFFLERCTAGLVAAAGAGALYLNIRAAAAVFAVIRAAFNITL